MIGMNTRGRKDFAESSPKAKSPSAVGSKLGSFFSTKRKSPSKAKDNSHSNASPSKGKTGSKMFLTSSSAESTVQKRAVVSAWDTSEREQGAVSDQPDAGYLPTQQPRQVVISRPSMAVSFGFGFGSADDGQKIVSNVAPGGPADGLLFVGDVINVLNSIKVGPLFFFCHVFFVGGRRR